MLVLSRKLGEKIRIGDDITIVVASIKGNVVRIGIEAPENVRILRSELAQPQENGEAQKEPVC